MRPNSSLTMYKAILKLSSRTKGPSRPIGERHTVLCFRESWRKVALCTRGLRRVVTGIFDEGFLYIYPAFPPVLTNCVIKGVDRGRNRGNQWRSVLHPIYLHSKSIS
jgi:hypothetical protein